MTVTPSPTKEWLKKLPSNLLEVDERPLLGFPPPFPWEKLAEELKDIFEIEALTLTPLEIRWLSKEQLYSGLPDKLIAKGVNIAPLEGGVSWVMPEEDIQSLLSLLLKKQPQGTEIFDREFLESFEQFLTLETLHTISHIGFDNSLSFHTQSENALPQEDALCLDVQIALPEKSFIGRLILSKAFQTSWKERYANRRLESPLERALAEKLDIFVSLDLGKTTLTPKEWKTIQLGDFLLLDTCSWDPSTNKGRVMLTVRGQPLFRGKVKDKTLKILEYPVYQEVDTIMEEEQEEVSPEEEEFEEEEEEGEEEGEEEEEEEEEVEEPESYEEEPPKEEAAVAPSEALEKISPEELPMTITVELTRLQMPLQKVMELQPGNLLELSMTPSDGVDLMVNGKRIAKGELLQIGETLGVRILDI